MEPAGEPRTCAACGRRIAPRRRWRADARPGAWDAVRWCSDACRRSRVGDTDRRLEAAILALLDARARGRTICPSEAARAVDAAGWRGLMEPARRAARRLVAAGRVEVLQGGRVVDPSRARGPIRLRRREAPPP